jgi:ABC-type antimicrobial peptide transport system permease subunit
VRAVLVGGWIAGVLTLIMACVGVYAVIAFGINQRTREIGIRIALGARVAQIVRLFFGEGFRLAGLGFAIGVPLTVTAMAVLTHGELNAYEWGVLFAPPRIAAVAIGLLGVIALACWIPARRSAGVDPMEAARSD